MTTKPDPFTMFVRRLRDNWHIYSALGAMGVFLIAGAADARYAIDAQGARLTAVEAKVSSDSDRISEINERSKITLQYVQEIDSRLAGPARRAP